MNQLNHSDMNSSCLILKESFIEIIFKACESNDSFQPYSTIKVSTQIFSF